MGASGPSSDNGRTAPTALAEINVTPMVDVMLVLLVIFMITASAQSFEMVQQVARLQEEQSALDQAPADQLVELDLPRADSKAVNLAEERKLVLSFTGDYTFHIGATRMLSCPETIDDWPTKIRLSPESDARFRACITPLVEKLLLNEKLKEDQELYLRADRGLLYGHVVMLMAAVREAGIHKFGLIAEDEGAP